MIRCATIYLRFFDFALRCLLLSGVSFDGGIYHH